MYRAVRTWMRRHPRIVDGAAAALLLLLTALGGYYGEPRGGAWWVPLAVAAGMCVPFGIRRQRPALTFVIAAVAAFVQWLLIPGLLPVDVVLFAALYNVASRCRWEIAALSAGVLELGAVLAVARWFAPYVGPGWWTSLISATILIGSMWIWGNSVRTRKAYLASLEDRAAQAERERDNQAQIAAAAERARIARELHDVVAHGLSVMVVQADGAAYALTTNQGQAQQALGTISSTGRHALAEMRRMLGVLRDGDGHHDYTPQPGVAQLDQLVEQVRKAGLPVEFTVDGVPQELPIGMELAAYRIVQEALTNTLKHAGPGVSCVRVRLSYGEGELEMRMTDDGRGAAAHMDGQGNGLLGMRERAAVYDGTVRAGPKDGGGYEVVASLPLHPTNAP